MHLKIAARQSPLSQAQVAEIIEEIADYQAFSFDLTLVETSGDKDQETSLRTMDKTNFFTKEIDQMILEEKCRIAIHSAKDLPNPLPEGLQIVAITLGVDPSDSLVLREGDSLETLPKNAVIGTSSERREEMIRELLPNCKIKDIRGTIEKRLEKMENGEVDGVIIAEAALIRLGLTHLNRIIIPGETVPYQGQLAIVARADDEEISNFFECIDIRPRTLYTGLEVPHGLESHRVFHCPLIQIEPRTKDQVWDSLKDLETYTHLIFTSKTTARIFGNYADMREIGAQCVIAVGRSTAKYLRDLGIEVDVVAKEETAEGIVAELKKMKLKEAHLFWPHSALSRSVITDFLRDNHIRFKECEFYDTHLRIPEDPPELGELDEIIFTSPSTVDAFLQCYGELPTDLVLTPIGPVTAAKLLECTN